MQWMSIGLSPIFSSSLKSLLHRVLGNLFALPRTHLLFGTAIIAAKKENCPVQILLHGAFFFHATLVIDSSNE